MSDKNDNVLQESYQQVSRVGDSYEPILIGNEPKNFVPPKGVTGARNIDVKVVTVNTEKKK